MKNILLTFLLFITYFTGSWAQVQKAEVKIYGLTCSLCSMSVEKSLEKLPYIEKIHTDLESTLTELWFKEGQEITPSEIAKAVKKAGFSVGYIKLVYNFEQEFSQCYEDKDYAFTFVDLQSEVSPGLHSLIFIQKDLMDNKLYKKYAANLPESCQSDKPSYYVAMFD